jgi:tetratricopeptide (TPR) repeat protein
LRSNDTLWTYEIRLQPENPNLRLYLSREQATAGKPMDAMRTALEAYERSLTPDTRAWAAVQWASQRSRVLNDADQPQLLELRHFYDVLMQPGAVPAGGVALDAGATILRVEPSRLMRDLMRESGAAQQARALLHARTGSDAIAEQVFRALLQRQPDAALAANLVRVVAFQERWDEARAVLDNARRAFPSDPHLTALASQLEHERRVRAIADPVEREVARVHLWLDLGSTRAARRTLAPLVATHAAIPEVVVADAFTTAEEGRLEDGRRILLAARDRDPAHRDTWNAAIAEFERRAGPAAPVRADLDALLR